MNASTNHHGVSSERLLGALPFVGRTFEGHFDDTPFVLDMDANLYIGPADDRARDMHAGVEVVFHFLRQTARIEGGFADLLRDRRALLDAFVAFDEARTQCQSEEFRILVFGTYDGELLHAGRDDDLPAGPCGATVNEVKQRFHALCRRLDPDFDARELSESQRGAEAAFSA